MTVKIHEKKAPPEDQIYTHLVLLSQLTQSRGEQFTQQKLENFLIFF